MKTIQRTILAIILLALGAMNTGCTAGDMAGLALLTVGALAAANNPDYIAPALGATPSNTASYGSSQCEYKTYTITGPNNEFMSCTQYSTCNITCY